MITIPAVLSADDVQSPAFPFPADVIAVVCDGSTYTVYQVGDAIPAVDGS